MQVAAFQRYVANHRPTSSYPELEAEQNHELDRAMDLFERTPGDSVESRMENLSQRAADLQDRGDLLTWGGVAATFGALIVSAALIPSFGLAGLAVPTVAALTVFGSGFVMSGVGNRLQERANDLYPYVKDFERLHERSHEPRPGMMDSNSARK